MNIKRIGRTLICLLMVCALLVNASPIRAEATSAGLVASIAQVTSVNGPAGLVYGAAAIALGVAAGANDDFRNMVDTAVAAGTEWVKDGTVELLRVVDEAGKAVYYAAGDMLESLRSWFFDTEVLQSSSCIIGKNLSGTFEGQSFTIKSDYDVSVVSVGYTYYDSNGGYYPYRRSADLYVFADANVPFKVTFSNGNTVQYRTNSVGASYYCNIYSYSGSSGQYYWKDPVCTGDISFAFLGNFADKASAVAAFAAFSPLGSKIGTSLDLTLGNVSSVPIDGSSALDWAPEYQANRLYVTGGSNDPEPPDENNGKWFWPLALTLTAADLYLMSQADEWSGETPQEFDDYTQNTEYEIISRPEFDGYTGIEISPKPEQSPDTGENPDIGGDTGTDEDAEITWFQRIVKGIEELPSKFGSWFDKILEWLEKIWEAIITLPETIADRIADVLQWAFAPSETFIQSKVEALIAKYPTADTFSNLGNSLNAFFGGLGATPPIIYIDLGAFEGSYLLGGREVFLDLTWYSRYKPTVDSIIGAFIWLWLAWRVFLSIPSIIHGEAGSWGDRKTDIGASNTSGATIVHQRELPSGKK